MSDQLTTLTKKAKKDYCAKKKVNPDHIVVSHSNGVTRGQHGIKEIFTIKMVKNELKTKKLYK